MSTITLQTPSVRAAIAATLIAGTLWYVRPEFAFQSNGRPKLSSWAARWDQRAIATPFPWYVVAASAGAAVLLFV